MENKFETVAQELAKIMHDSHVTLDVSKLQTALYDDYLANGNNMLDLEECEEFICGGEDGDVDVGLMRLFPKTSEYINSFF